MVNHYPPPLTNDRVNGPLRSHLSHLARSHRADNGRDSDSETKREPSTTSAPKRDTVFPLGNVWLTSAGTCLCKTGTLLQITSSEAQLSHLFLAVGGEEVYVVRLVSQVEGHH